MATDRRRGTPAGVAIVAVLALAAGAVQLVGGLLLLVFNDDVGGYTSGEAVVFGIVTLVIGLIYLWVGRGLLRLHPLALGIGLVVSGLRTIYDVAWLIGIGVDGIGISGIAALIFNAVVFLALLSGRRAFAAEPAR